MKVLDVIKGSEGSIGWRSIADSVIIKDRNPFFLPDFEGGVSMRGVIALRIGRLGKGISARFAGRYWNEAAPAFLFRAEEYGARLRQSGLPDDAAFSFDRALMLGDFVALQEMEDSSCHLSLGITPSPGAEPLPELEATLPNLEKVAAEAISMLSRDNTLRMGDIILLHFDPDLHLQAEIGMRASLKMDIFTSEDRPITSLEKQIRIL